MEPVHADHHKYLRPLYIRENPLRAISAEAARIEKEEQAPAVVRCNVGDPTGPTLDRANWAVAEYYLTRPVGTGYTDHTGHPALRKIAAELLEKIDRLPPGTLDADKVFCIAGGTGGLNSVLSIFNSESTLLLDDPKDGKPKAVFSPIPGKTQVLVTDPFYPPWGPISERNNLEMIRFELRPDDNYLLNKNILREKLLKADPALPIVLMYHYPHNPVGKTLTAGEAREVADTLNELIEEFPNLYLVQEDLYLATIRSDLGIHTPMEHLSRNALERTMLVHSPSKEGHGQDRGALIATPSAEIAKRLRGTTAFSSLGTSTGALLGTIVTLTDIANGIDPKTPENADNHRYATADYYQGKMAALGQGCLDLEKVLGVEILDNGIPEGTYYLWTKFDFLKGKKVPIELQSPLYQGDQFLGMTPETIETGGDLSYVLSRAHHLGLLPVMAAPGELFTGQNDELRMRLAAVDRDTEKLHEASNTIKGVSAAILGLDLHQLGVKVRTIEELREKFPPGRSLDEFDIAALVYAKPDPIMTGVPGHPPLELPAPAVKGRGGPGER